MANELPKFAFYQNIKVVIPYNCGIHPGPRNRTRSRRKRANNLDNHIVRAETNQARANSVMKNPTWHGVGRHAGVPRGY